MKTKKIHKAPSYAVPNSVRSVRVTKKGAHFEIVVIGCNVNLSDEKLGIDLVVKQP